MPRLYPPFPLLLACPLLFAAAQAQSTFGSLRGTFQDASGAVIPGAQVGVHSLDENFDRQVTTNASGDFVVENLKPGHYKLTVHHERLSDPVVSSVKLDARQDLRIPITLKIAAASTLIEVSAAPDQINTENGTLSDSISGRHENDLRETLRHLSQSISN